MQTQNTALTKNTSKNEPKLSMTLLRHIGKLMSEGKYEWGLLLANEYLRASDPLRMALVSKARTTNGRRSQRDSTLLERLIEGKTRAELPQRFAAQIQSKSGSVRSVQRVPFAEGERVYCRSAWEKRGKRCAGESR